MFLLDLSKRLLGVLPLHELVDKPEGIIIADQVLLLVVFLVLILDEVEVRLDQVQSRKLLLLALCQQRLSVLSIHS